MTTKITAELYSLFVTLEKEGKSIQEISKLTEQNYHFVYKYLRLAGVDTKTKKRHYKINTSYFKNIDTEAKAYYLGFIQCDANITDRNIHLTLNRKDRAILELLCNEIGITHTYPKDFISHKEFEHSQVIISSKEICNDLEKFNIIPKKSYSIKFCANLIDNNELIRHYIRGCFDADGHISTRKDGQLRIGICSCSYDFLMELQKYLCLILNLNPTKIRKSKTNNVYNFAYSGNNAAKKLATYLYSNCNFFLARKRSKLTLLNIEIEKHKTEQANLIEDCIKNKMPKIFTWNEINEHLKSNIKYVWGKVQAGQYLKNKYKSKKTRFQGRNTNFYYKDELL